MSLSMNYHHALLSLPAGEEFRRRQLWRKQRNEQALRAATIDADADFVARTTAAVAQCAAELRESAFWKSMQEALEVAAARQCDNIGVRPQELVCFGIGALDNVCGAHQLGLLTLMAEELGLGPDRVFGFDPMFTPREREVLVRCGCTVLEVDKHARVPTLYYMPHCHFALLNNLVHANWAAPWNVMLLGNDVRFHALNNASFATVAPQLAKAMRVMQHTRLPDTFVSPNPVTTKAATSTQIFDLGSVYTFPPKKTWDAALADGETKDSNWQELVRWMRDGPGELPTATNLRKRLVEELREVEARATFLRRQLSTARSETVDLRVQIRTIRQGRNCGTVVREAAG